MEIKYRSKDYIILEDIPMIGPVAAYSMIGTGLLPIIIIFARFPHQKLLALWGFLVVLIGIFLLFRLKEQSKVVLDRSRKSLVIIRKKPLGGSQEKAYDLEDIQDFSIEANPDGKGQRLTAHLKNGGQAPFTPGFNTGVTNSFPGICRTLKQYVGM